MKEEITLTKGENLRVMALTELEAGRLTVEDVARAIGVTVRHVRRLLLAFRQEGAAGLAHGNRGRSPGHRYPGLVREKVVGLAKEKYAGFNQQHFTEKLAIDEKLFLSRSTVRRMLEEAGISAPNPQRRTRHRRRRLREAAFGAMLQMDGSIHDWTSGRCAPFTLLGAIDDATGHVWACFTENEDLAGYFALLKEIAKEQGLPRSVYTDRHLMFLGIRRSSERVAKESVHYETQFTKLMARLGVVHIRAYSPQAKGRVERLWKTLQDRLVSELRAEGVTSIARANIVLRKHLRIHNQTFTVQPRDTASAWRSLPEDADLDELFAHVESRVVRNDNTVTFYGHVLQLEAGPKKGWAGSRVEIRELPTGELRVYLGQESIPIQRVQGVSKAA